MWGGGCAEEACGYGGGSCECPALLSVVASCHCLHVGRLSCILPCTHVMMVMLMLMVKVNVKVKVMVIMSMVMVMVMVIMVMVMVIMAMVMVMMAVCEEVGVEEQGQRGCGGQMWW